MENLGPYRGISKFTTKDYGSGKDILIIVYDHFCWRDITLPDHNGVAVLLRGAQGSHSTFLTICDKMEPSSQEGPTRCQLEAFDKISRMSIPEIKFLARCEERGRLF